MSHWALQEIIHETPLIKQAIEQDKIPLLYDSLNAMFRLREELQEMILHNQQQESSPTELTAELQVLEETMGRVICYLAEWKGVGGVAGQLFLKGTVKTRGEVLRLAAPIYDWMDTEEFEEVDITMIGVVGKIASGKGTIGEILQNKYHGFHLPLSDRLRESALAQGSLPPHSREKLREINEMKKRFGNPVFVRWTMEMAKRLSTIYEANIFSIDGFRSLEEAQLFRERGGILIAVTASPDTRYQRVLERKRGADDFSRKSFDESDRIESEWIDPIIEIADVVIENESSVEMLEKMVMDFVGKKFGNNSTY